MSDLVLVGLLVVNAVAITDILRKLTGGVERLLWCVGVLAVPYIGAAYWYHVQYAVPEARRLKREERRRKLAVRQNRGEAKPPTSPGR